MATTSPLEQVTIVALIAIGTFFLTVGTIGLLRLPNVYNRMHATSKPTTLGTAAVFLAGFIQFGPGGAGLTSLVGIVFLFLTVPTGAHMISRAAQKTGVPFLSGVTWPADESEEGESDTDAATPGSENRTDGESLRDSELPNGDSREGGESRSDAEQPGDENDGDDGEK